MWLGLGGLAGVAVLGGAALWWRQPAPPAAPEPAVAALPRPVTGAPPAAEPEAPRFDVARVGAQGAAVVAGRAAPGAEVSLRDQDRELGRARADARGEFVILPTEPLAPGPHALTLRTRDAAGQERQGSEEVVVLVPDAARPGDAPVAVLLPPPGAAAPPRVLQAAPPAGGGRLNLDVVDYDEAGAMRFAGTAPPGGRLRLYVDQHHAGDAAADAAGRWMLSPQPVPEPGRHTLRVDQIGSQGRVLARLELPFQREAAGVAAVGAVGRMVVQPGHNLWRIARETYGRGIRYTVIQQANADQIRDPARIYPGQVFALPSP